MSTISLVPSREEKLEKVFHLSEPAVCSLTLRTNYLNSVNNESGILEDMERRGEIKLGSSRLPKDFWALSKPYDPEGLVRRALIEDRNRDL